MKSLRANREELKILVNSKALQYYIVTYKYLNKLEYFTVIQFNKKS